MKKKTERCIVKALRLGSNDRRIAGLGRGKTKKRLRDTCMSGARFCGQGGCEDTGDWREVVHILYGASAYCTVCMPREP